MRFLKEAYLYVVGGECGTVPDKEEFEKIFSQVELIDADFNVEKFPAGTSGESGLLNYLQSALSELNENE